MTTNTAATKAGDLLPCPFCGSKTLYVKHEPGTILHPAYYVHCDDCGAQSGAWERGEHIEEWNRRAAAPAEPASAAEGAADGPITASCKRCRGVGYVAGCYGPGSRKHCPDCHGRGYHFNARPKPAPDPAQSADTPSEVLTQPARDDPELDGTDAAHPAWWRGQQYGADAICREVNKILDGNGNESGVGHEPLESTRRRLFALLAQPARGEVSEAEVEAALAAYYASFQCGKESGVYYDEQTRKAGMRAALEAAARVRGK